IGLIYPLDTIQFFEISLRNSDVILLLGVFLLCLTVFTKNKFTFNDAGFLLISVMYIGLSFNYLIDIRLSGLNYLLFILFFFCFIDSCDYFFVIVFGYSMLFI